MSNRRDLERRAFKLILEAGEEGFLQAEMWKRLGIDNNEGSKITRGLEKKKAIKRQRELHDGRWTYRLISLKNQITVDSIIDCPCMACDEMDKCFPGGHINPNLCTILTQWIHECSRNEGINS